MHSKVMVLKLDICSTVFAAVLCFSTVQGAQGWGSSGNRVLLRDVNVVTLYHGRMTTGRRSSPVPQLKCLGGSASGAFVPQVVQCYNRGWDGMDIQWECKSDMDNAYRFGKVEMVCEGYDYPEDPYILSGSCGLEYTLDFTKEGMERNEHKHHNYYGGKSYSDSYSSWRKYKPSGIDMGDLVLLGVIGIVIYAIYVTCLSSRNENRFSSVNDDYQSSDQQPPGGGGWFSGGTSPPPPGFRDDYTSGASCSGTRYRGRTGGNPFGGFWTGMATGGLMGYMFGNRNTGYNHAQPSYRHHTPSYGFTSGSGSSSSSGSHDGSTGTRTASGFGGTRRR